MTTSATAAWLDAGAAALLPVRLRRLLTIFVGFVHASRRASPDGCRRNAFPSLREPELTGGQFFVGMNECRGGYESCPS
jgi:hypothetical protein